MVRRSSLAAWILVLALLLAAGGCRNAPQPALEPADAAAAEDPALEDPFEDEAEDRAPAQIADPIEPVNRAFFTFNDRLYFWVLKPAARGYRYVVPERGRKGVRNFFRNVATPIRFTNCLLQADFKGSGTELLRFGLNTTVGVLGVWDPARHWFDIQERKEDFGQTLGVYGIGHGIYICWPVLGPSSIRDTFGLAGDYALHPFTYITCFGCPYGTGTGLYAFGMLNDTSLTIGDYEKLKDAALDPYIAVRNAYNQHRRKAVDTRR
jgi:phospholipid-binding lipoprotein MlaA